MRKKALVILMAAAVFALAGCGDKSDKDTGKEDKKQEETSAETETPGEAEPEVDMEGPAAEAEQISESDGRKLMETAVAFTEDLIAANHDNLVNNYEYEEGDMKTSVENGELEQAISSAAASSGEFKGTKAAWLGDQAGDYTNVQVPCEFADQPWNMFIAFAADGKIGGVRTDVYKETP